MKPASPGEAVPGLSLEAMGLTGDQARKARAVLRKALKPWLSEYVPLWIERAPGGECTVRRGKEIVARFSMHQVPARLRPEIVAVLDAFDREAGAMSVAYGIIKSELDQRAKSAEAAPEGGKRNARHERATVEQLMRAQMRQGADPRAYFAAWAEEYGYSTRHLRNILKRVQAETS